jgi:Co/Zn/Cd efflux system component
MSSSPPAKTRAATVSLASNSFLITIKVAAGLLTGSVGILSDAIHSLMDLIASGVAYASVRKADEPADPSTATDTKRSRISRQARKRFCCWWARCS